MINWRHYKVILLQWPQQFFLNAKVMNNNDILRRIRFALTLNDKQMIAIFAHMEQQISEAVLHQYLAKEDDKDYSPLRDKLMGAFLDGLIIEKRGRKEDTPLPALKKRLTINEMLMKLRIALMLKAEDMIEILALADFRLSKSELSAFFRKPDHRNYKSCGTQVLRNFLFGLTKKLRPESDKTSNKKMTKPKLKT